jgi:hypothetical protein
VHHDADGLPDDFARDQRLIKLLGLAGASHCQSGVGGERRRRVPGLFVEAVAAPRVQVQPTDAGLSAYSSTAIWE